MDVVPLGPGFAAELRGVALATSPTMMPPIGQCGPPSKRIRYSSFAIKR